MRLFKASLVLIVLLVASLNAQSVIKPAGSQSAKLPAAAPLLTPSLCGPGVFLLSIGSQDLGRESFEIKCAADGGFSASGNTKLQIPGQTFDLNTSLDVDKSGVPLKFTASGAAGLQTLDQVVTFTKTSATVTTKGQSQEVPYQGGAVFLGNVAYLYQFLLARYDAEKGGLQKIDTFGQGSLGLERTARDEVQPAGMVPGPPAAFDRYSLTVSSVLIIIWTDKAGRIIAMNVPAQKFSVVREDYKAFAQPLNASLLASVKGLADDYSAPRDAPFTAEEVTIKVKDFSLAGTLLLPRNAKGRLPAVVMSTGSGQQKRDEQVAIPSLEGYRPFRQIAETLASRGIAVLRCDDRGVGDSTGLSTLSNATTFDFADDVRAQVAYLRTRTEIDPSRIAIAGHSEGGMIAPLVAAGDKRIAAIVLLAGPGKRGDEVLRYQLNYPADNNPKLSAAEKAKAHQDTDEYLLLLASGGDVSKYPMELRALASAWARAFLPYDPLTTIRKVRQPILIVQGSLDQQVTAEQATLLNEAARNAGNKDVSVNVFPGLNHFFLPAKTGSESEYGSLSTIRIGDDVLNTIADWLVLKLHVAK